VERRARKILNPPAGVSLVFGDNMIRVTGIADLAWRQHLQSRMALIAGIDSYDDTALKTQFAESMLAPPPGVSMQLEAGVLYVEGAAENEWILSLAAAAEQFVAGGSRRAIRRNRDGRHPRAGESNRSLPG